MSPSVPARRSCSSRRGRSAALVIALATLSTTAVPALVGVASAADTTAPAPIAGLVTTSDKTRIKLDWTGNLEKDLAGYLVYRSSAADGTYSRLTSAPVTGSEYSDYASPAGMRSYYRITAVDTSANESTVVSSSGVRSDGVAPTAPRALTATRTEAGVSLDWADNSESDLAGYVVSRATSSGGTYTKLMTSPLRTSGYVDGTASTTANYYYKVTAVDLGGATSSGTSVAALLPDTAAPAAVRSMTVTASTTGIKLDWSSNSESDLAGYRVSRATSAGGTYALLTPSLRTSSDYTDTTAPTGVPSYYRVTAVDRSGNESAPVSASGTRKDGVAPAAPRGLTGTGSASGVVLDWTDSPEADLAGYVVSRATSSGGTYTRLTATPTAASTYVDTAAPAGTVSYYRVVAVDVSGNTSAAASTSATLPDTAAPAAVRSMLVSVDTSRVKLDWASNSESDLAGYRVYRAASADGEYVQLTATPRTSSDYSDTAAPAGVASYYRVTAVDRSGNESASVSATGTRKDGVAPVAVKGLTATGSVSGVALDWTDSTEPDLAGYVVSRAPSSGGTYTRLTATPITTSAYVDSAAPAGVASYYRVAAVDLSGNTSTVTSISATVPDSTAPQAPTGLTATAGDAQVALAWTRSPEVDVAGYRLSRWSADADSSTAVPVTSSLLTSTTYTDRAVVNGGSYLYRLTAVDRSGNESLAGDQVAAAPADLVAPPVPTAVTGTGTSTGVTLTWAASAAADLAGYLVYRGTSADGDFVRLTQGPLTTPGYTDTAAPAHATSHYRVTAVDRTGNESAASSIVSAAPADTTAPGQPVELAAVGTETGVSLTWTANTEPDLAGYQVLRSDSATGTFTPLTPGLTSATTFEDSSAPSGVVAYYRVAAVDTTGNASTAATASARRIVVKVPVAGADVTVAQDGSGDHLTVAAALAAAPASAATPYVIGIRPGTYRELLTVSRPNVTLLGATGNAADVVLTYDNASGTINPATGAAYGTTGSATMLIKASNVTTKNLTIENAYRETGTGAEQAVALKTTGDRLLFDNVRLLGDQDTLYVDSPGAGALARSYYVNSYVEGDVDFVFGRGTAVFDRSTLKAATRGSATNNGYVTAASTDKSLTYGFLITDSTIVSDAPANSFALGRPWQPSGDVNAVAQVVIRNTELPAAVKTSPWNDMTTTFSWRDARLFEYQNTGAGAGVNADRPQLSDADAALYTRFTYLAGTDGWNPTGLTPPAPPADTVAPAAPAAPAATAGDSRATISWTASTEPDLAGYNLYRAAAGTADTSSTKVNAAGLLTGTTVTDGPLVNDTAYSYAVTAVDKAGNESPVSTPVSVTPVSVPLPAHDLLVAADGSGDHTTVQAAITAAPPGTAAKPTVIAVKPGTYRELITVTRSHLTLIGTTGDASDVVLTFDNAAGTTNPATGAPYGTGASQSVLVSGSNVTMRYLTIENAFDEAAHAYSAEQAVALKTTGDRLVFDSIRLLGNQDTLLVDSPDAPVVARSYFTRSFIQGDVDFIFGRGTAVFDRSTISALSRGSSSNNGYLTAASTSDKNPYGFLITDSTVTSNAPAGTFSLGRPWRGWSDGYTKNGVVYNSRGQVTVRNTVLPSAIRSTQPWADMSPNLWTDGRFSEHGNTGPGAGVNANRPQLTEEQALGSTKWTYLSGSDGWNPTGQSAPKVVDTTAPAAPTALAAAAGDSKAVLSWKAPADTDVTGYHVYRSSGDASTRVTAEPVTATSFTDTGLTNGTAYTWTVIAVDDSGNESVVSAPAAATPAVGDSVAPAIPTGVSTVLGKSSVTVRWNAVGDADLASYTVYRATGSGAPVRLGSATGTSFTDTTGTVGTAYRYTVTASDGSGNESAASSGGTATPVKADVVVAADGTGDATTIQAGINLLADNADYTTQGGRVVVVQPGTYTGVVSSGNRYGVTLLGATADAKDTVITAGGTGAVATVTLAGKAWTLRDLTVANTNAAGTQGTALQVKAGDKMVFDNVRFLGDGQVLQVSTANLTTFSRAYFRSVYVEGGADMIIGRAVAVFEDSTFRVLNRPGASITDSSIAAEAPYGFLITGSRIVTDGAAGSIHLGRPYGTQGKAQVVVRDTDLGAGINTAKPWKDWDATTTWTAGRFFEHRNTGAGAAITDGATRPQLTDADAATYTARAYLAGTDNWNPTGS